MNPVSYERAADVEQAVRLAQRADRIGGGACAVVVEVDHADFPEATSRIAATILG